MTGERRGNGRCVACRPVLCPCISSQLAIDHAYLRVLSTVRSAKVISDAYPLIPVLPFFSTDILLILSIAAAEKRGLGGVIDGTIHV